MSAQDDKQLSDDLRAYMQTISPYARQQVQRLMLSALDVQNLRNIELYTNVGAVQRNFINRTLSPRERKKRTLFARALLEGYSTNRSTKSTSFSAGSNFEESRFAGWMNDPFTLGYRNGYFPSLLKLSVDSSGGILMVYDSYPDPNPDEPAEANPDDEDYDDVGLN